MADEHVRASLTGAAKQGVQILGDLQPVLRARGVTAPALPGAVIGTEAAAYFCVLEALQNTAKYAQASAAQVTLCGDGQYLVFTVTDDGKGFDPASTPKGTGLQGIADRLGALGGTIAHHLRPRPRHPAHWPGTHRHHLKARRTGKCRARRRR